jgi:hypothetical protein
LYICPRPGTKKLKTAAVPGFLIVYLASVFSVGRASALNPTMRRRDGFRAEGRRPDAESRLSRVRQAISTNSIAKVRASPASGWFASSVT